MRPNIILIAHNLRSCHNVGSLLRTSEGLGVNKVYLTGYTPYPAKDRDSRLPHIVNKLTKQIQKTSLGAEHSVNWKQSDDIKDVIKNLKNEGYEVCALEQTNNSIELSQYSPPKKVAIIVGRETEGIEENVLLLADYCLEIPMFGQKESFNVVQAAAMALFHLCFYSA